MIVSLKPELKGNARYDNGPLERFALFGYGIKYTLHLNKNIDYETFPGWFNRHRIIICDEPLCTIIKAGDIQGCCATSH